MPRGVNGKILVTITANMKGDNSHLQVTNNNIIIIQHLCITTIVKEHPIHDMTY